MLLILKYVSIGGASFKQVEAEMFGGVVTAYETHSAPLACLAGVAFWWQTKVEIALSGQTDHTLEISDITLQFYDFIKKQMAVLCSNNFSAAILVHHQEDGYRTSHFDLFPHQLVLKSPLMGIALQCSCCYNWYIHSIAQ